MADAPGSLGDFFAKKKKKNIKGSNLNNEATKPAAGEEKKPKSAKDKEEEGWEEEQVAAPTMKVEVAGKLTREDEKKEEEDTAAPAWRSTKTADNKDLNHKKFPSLAKAVGQSSNINIDDGSEPTINIKTNKNVFASLADEDDLEDTRAKRPKEIKPAMVQKQKGERETVAIQREVDKYGGQKKEKEEAKKKKDTKKKKEAEVEDDDDDEEAEEEEDAKKKRKDNKKAADKAEEPAKPVELEEDVMIQPDLEASRLKYRGRAKLPTKALPASELEEEKENRPAPAAIGKKKKKGKFFDEEDEKPKKLLVADWDD